ncbi:TcmI family type II polyketide cyclase [Kitasatospora sp. NPDC089509]|uniref:TcmI family type II polyketide cyclase n=1 Tax=Kitasatospora sp. NPDC089509 TaxID=3364079 RepID=UPI0038289D81
MQHSTLIVARTDRGTATNVASLFGEYDGTKMPHLMGIRRCQLFSHRGLYFHCQGLDSENGSERSEAAKTDPGFAGISEDLRPLVQAYDQATWRSPAGVVAQCSYHSGAQ